MNGKKLFFLSLILLSVVMGRDWLKNRPKQTPKIKRPVVAAPVDLDDVASGTLASGTANPVASGTESPGENASEPTDVASAPLDASGTPEIASETASAPAVISDQDPVAAAWEKISRSPFEPSPFSKMLEEVGKKSGGAGEAVATIKRKPTLRLDPLFTGLIETDQDLIAVISGKLFKPGDDYEGKDIKKVGTQVILLEDPGAYYVMPKRGIAISIASDGTVDITGDSFKK